MRKIEMMQMTIRKRIYTNDDKKENIYKKFYASNCHAEGTGCEPPVLALRLDTPVIVYWNYIILDRLVDYIFREVFA